MKNLLHKISIITFMLYYIVIASGVNIKLHYCEGKISDFAVNTNNTYCEMHKGVSCNGGSCSSHEIDSKHISEKMHCEADLPRHCCTNQEVYIAIKTLLNFSSKNFEIKSSEIDLINITDYEELVNDNSNNFELINILLLYNYPPPYLVFQQLLVYS